MNVEARSVNRLILLFTVIREDLLCTRVGVGNTHMANMKSSYTVLVTSQVLYSKQVRKH